MERDFTINKLIAEKIKDECKRPSAIADKAGIRRDTFSKIIHCKRPIFADELFPILAATGISPQQAMAVVGTD